MYGRRRFLDLLYDDAPRADVRPGGRRRGGVRRRPRPRSRQLRRQHDVALRLRELIARQRAREAELSALYETAGDLTAIRDVDAILAAIVRRARQLLRRRHDLPVAERRGRRRVVHEGHRRGPAQEFRTLRLPLGTGLLGLVAQTGAPYFTEDYQADERFVHRGYIDEAVAGERIRAILGSSASCSRGGYRRAARRAPLRAAVPGLRGVPVDVIRGPRRRGARERRLFADVDHAHRAMSEHTAPSRGPQRARPAHRPPAARWWRRRVAAVLAEVLGGRVAIYEPDGTLRAGEARRRLARAVPESVASGRSVQVQGYVAAAAAGPDHLATLVCHGSTRPRARRAPHPRARRPSPPWCCSLRGRSPRPRSASAASC